MNSSINASDPADVDVIVVGAGACGLVAALQLAERDLTIAIVENNPVAGTNTALSSGMLYAAGTRYQDAYGINDSPEGMAIDILRKNSGQCDVEVLNALCKISAATLHWLNDSVGYPLELALDVRRYGQSFPRAHADPKRRGGEWLIRVLLRRARDLSNILIVEHAQFDRILTGKPGVTGVEVTIGGRTERILASHAVVLACGGFGANSLMVEEFCHEGASLEYVGSPATNGAGIRAGMELGAAVDYMSAFQGHGFYNHETGARISPGVVVEGGICVKTDGRRFVAEDIGYSEMAIEISHNHPPAAIVIFDGDILKKTENVEIMRDALKVRAVTEHNSVDDLARFYDLDAGALLRTIEDYNAVPLGQPDDFGRKSLGTALKLPLYASKIVGALAHTQGGLRVDKNARVLDEIGQPIPHLYAGGGCAAGISGESYDGYSPGNGLLSAMGFGALAAQHIISAALGEQPLAGQRNG